MLYGHLESRGSNVDHPRPNRFFMRSLTHGNRAKIIQSLGEKRSEAERHVLHDQNWNGKIGWQRRKNLLKGTWASCRNSQSDNLRAGERGSSYSQVHGVRRLSGQEEPLLGAPRFRRCLDFCDQVIADVKNIQGSG